MTRILVSGFEAFGGQSINPTQKLIESLRTSQAGAGRLRLPAGADVRATVLPVTFAAAYDQLRSEIRSFDPHVVLALGQAGGRGSIDLERVALNVLDADQPDNDGFQPRDLPIISDGAPAHFSTLPIRKLQEALSAAEIPVKISNTAGLYVCNFLLYRLLEDNKRTTRQCGFVHVPFLPEQVANRPGVASMSFEQMENALEVMLETLAKR